MKRLNGGSRSTQKFHAADGSLEKQIVKNTGQLRHISRFLLTANAWNRALVRATETLVRSIAHDTDRESARLTSRKQLGELRTHYNLLTPRERQVMTFVVKSLLAQKEVGKSFGC